MSEASLTDLLIGAIFLGVPAAILVNALFRSPRKLSLDERLSLLTVPLTIFQLFILGRIQWVEAGPWFEISLWVRLAYCAMILCISLSVPFSRVASWSQGIACVFTLLSVGLLSAGLIWGLVFGVPYL
jgi:hypothetical protein